MASYWPEPKSPSGIDRYEVVIDSTWLNGETIQSATWSVAIESGLTISDELITDNTLSALFTGGNLGSWCVTINVVTATRNKDFCAILSIKGCC